MVLSYAEAANEVTEDEDCSRGLGGAWNELQLLRIEMTVQGKDVEAASTKEDEQQEGNRVGGNGGDVMGASRVVRKELFLGDLHTDPSKQDLYRPTGYQTPLLHAKYVSVLVWVWWEFGVRVLVWWELGDPGVGVVGAGGRGVGVMGNGGLGLLVIVISFSPRICKQVIIIS